MSAEVERWREAREIYGRADLPKVVKAGDALAAALEAAEIEKAHLTKVATEYQSRIAELEAGLRRIAEAGGYVRSGIARDLLAGRAAGGEG